MNIKITLRAQLIFLLLASLAALIFAYAAQFLFDYQPCILCLYQRKPFFAIVATTLLALIFFRKESRQKIALLLCIIFLLINSSIAIYHVGVEQKIFKGPSSCSSESLNDLENLDDLRNALIKTKAVRCDEPSFFFLGLSMAAWNVIYCSVILLLRRRFGLKK